jgi:hypothetical protein
MGFADEGSHTTLIWAVSIIAMLGLAGVGTSAVVARRRR